MMLKLLLLSYFIYKSNTLQCRDENNNPVDWFVAYKLPTLKENGSELVENGLAYTYMTSQNYDHWIASEKSINATTSMIGFTLRDFYNKDENKLLYILYNDQPPGEPSNESKGHNKGVLLANSSGGFWLVHSTPHFPPTQNYSFPETGTRYGQSFLCISMDVTTLNDVGLQLQYNEPEIYAQNIPKTIAANISELVRAANNETVTSAPWFRKTSIISRSGVNFTSFAKHGRFGKDLYEDWLAPALQSNLFVETWPNGPGKLPSNCSRQFQVHNVNSVGISEANATFKTTHDHSKWAVSENKDWICIGDINRMEHQTERGGGTVCLRDKALANVYVKSVTSVEECKNNVLSRL